MQLQQEFHPSLQIRNLFINISLLLSCRRLFILSLVPMKLRFNIGAFLVFLLILLIEICIALYVHDRIIRPYGGDVLVVVLLFYFVKSFIALRTSYNITGVLLFSFAVETAQYFNLVSHLGLVHSRFWTIIIGNSFHWFDMLSYILGAILVCLLEYGLPLLLRKQKAG